VSLIRLIIQGDKNEMAARLIAANKSDQQKLIDRRLIGAWKSDKQRTLDYMTKNHKLTNKQKVLYRKIFGKLELRYTTTKIYSNFKGKRAANPYRVLASDAHSVAITSLDMFGNDRITHLHFDGNHYWITLGIGPKREYFKRMTPSRGGKKLSHKDTKTRRAPKGR
jgi:hypothetical protein